MKSFFNDWWESIRIPQGDDRNLGYVASWFSAVLGQISALLLGGLGGTYVQGLLHTNSAIANIAVLVGTALVSLFVGWGLQYGTSIMYSKTSEGSAAEWTSFFAFVLINIAMIVAAGIAVYAYFAQSIQVSSNIAIGALVLSIALKLGSLLLVGVIIPIFKSIPALIFGLVARDWYAKRKARQKAKVR